MSTVLVRRPARLPAPDPGDEPVVVAAPPVQQEPANASMSAAMVLMPVISGSGSLLIALTNGDRPLFAAAGLLFLVASVAVGVVMFVSARGGPRKRMREQRERYLDYLEDMRRSLRQIAATQRMAGGFGHPAPALLLDFARLPARRWERRAADRDFLDVRVGTGVRPLARPLTLQVDRSSPLVVYDPVCLGAAQQLVGRYESVSGAPLLLRLRDIGVLAVRGDRDTGRRLARALLAQLVTHHSPENVRVAVVRHPSLVDAWDWAKWLPHCVDESRRDGPLPLRLFASSTVDLLELVGDDLEARREERQRRRGQPPGPGVRRLVVVVDGEFQSSLAGLLSEEPLATLGVHVVVLLGSRREEPERVDERIEVTADGTGRRESDAAEFTVDDVAAADLVALARELAPVRLAEDDASDLLHSTVGLGEILGVGDAATLDPKRTWRPRPPRDFLRVPIGVGADGELVSLDLKESAFGGMGPHGLVVGATGSGKSELLRTLVTSLAIAHPPHQLAFLLVDFKGGATFADLHTLPHTTGMVTNLADDMSLVDRFRLALTGEMLRRQQLLADAGKLPNVDAYAQRHPDAEPLPHLLVIIDEFSELLTAKPDFADLFVQVGRIGRSIGVHLLLATQRLEAGKIRGLESHLSYRIGLRTFSEAESREVIGAPDAYHLPPEPGSGYLKVDTTVFARFKAAMASVPYQPRRDVGGEVAPAVPYLSSNGLGALVSRGAAAVAAAPSVADGDTDAEVSVLQVAVRRLGAAGAAPARPIWLDPLPAVLSLNAVPATPADADRVVAPIGLTDRPEEQRQDPLEWDFTGAEGNVIVMGAPLTGKSTLLRTLVAGMALRYAPGQVAFFCVDYGGGALTPLEELPHVAAVATRADPDRVRRTVNDVRAMLDSRERVMRRRRLDSPAALRRARAAGTLPQAVHGDLFLVVDGWGTLREADPELEDIVAEIAARGPALGVHTVLTVTGGTQVRVRLATSFGGRIELRLGDPFDSQIDRSRATELPKDRPGRVLVPGGHYAQVALPRCDGLSTVDDLAAGAAQLAAEVARRWPGRRVPLVQSMPEHIALADVPGVDVAGEAGVVIGVSDHDLGPARVDLFGADPHLLFFGDAQTGKSTALRTLLRQLMASRTPEQLGIVLVDYRRAHLGVVPDEYLLAYCTAAPQTAQVTADVVGGLQQRLPGSDVTPAQLRDRSWWRGVDVVVVADDYDLVATGSGNPLAPLAEYVPQGGDLGLHLVLARRTGGASRALYEPVIQAVNDLSSPGLLLSGDRMEGRLVNGVASQRLPAGRALWATRGQPTSQVQIAWTAPPA